MLNSIKLKDKILEVPIIQGGMGVGISLSNLVGNVMKENCMGVLSFAHPGYNRSTFITKTSEDNFIAMKEEVDKARKISEGKGLLGVNIMVATSQYALYVKECVKLGVDAIISGAGLPLNLPELTKGSDVLIAPIVSSAKALNLIIRRWDQHHNKIPDFVVIEGSEAGGHLGFKKDDVLNDTCESIDEILEQCLKLVVDYEEKYNQKIPIFVAGGIFTGKDIAKYVKQGASGVQIGTRFIATEECDANEKYKEMFVKAKREDIIIVKSPAGFPGRAIRNKFTERLDSEGRIPVRYCVDCILPCNPKNTVYCITDALIRAVKGDVENGLIFSGTNAYRIDKITTVKEIISELVSEANNELR
ncbi:NAD(P)H-dependent flavin oxidoreductase [Parvimonas micra]|uniref:NAD(P)H-dependent flavin oxidoreductase n=1 Tax=Parvimonas micra TaxID=33033 RepID=UPI002004C769|nr:nitronate monooxygenase family protein [Parvimonas micra]MCK6130955.1 nitronate monooxygenase family protein [Parvimonas micra]MCK6136600.1 nitronate monooxygenase family protein [Parvimonas micra]MCK6138071.1 nitronate monooxygenase family protein [Parvimonas micra]MCK6154599.1 nitronate monooxygenase family protein [Parvimonas micra]